MATIIAHIKGPSGGGKTTIGEIINRKFPLVKNIDTDDILLRDLPSMFPQAYAKYLAKDELNQFLMKYFKKGLEKALKPYKYVILVGDMRIIVDGEYHNIGVIGTENKYIIDIEEELLMRRRFDRHLKFMAENTDHYYKKAQRKPLCVDLELWRGERLYWGHLREEYYEKATQDGYLKLSQEKIIEKLKEIIMNTVRVIKSQE